MEEKSVAQRARSIAKDPKVEKALSLRLQGYTWRAIGAELGCDHNDIYKRTKPYEMLLSQEEGYQTLKAKAMSVALEATAQVSDALVAGEIPKQSLPVVMGIAVDKVARLLQAERPQENHEQNPLLAMLAKIHESGGTMKLEVTQPKTMDVEIVSESK